jgi:hypothetical protein
LPSNKKFGKISYLNSQTKPWKEIKMENYMVNHEKKFFFHCGIQHSRDFFKFLNLNNFIHENKFFSKMILTPESGVQEDQFDIKKRRPTISWYYPFKQPLRESVGGG